MVWTEELRNEAARLWRAGNSAEQIAKALDVTRNAVCGVLHRQKLTAHDEVRRYQRNQRAANAVPVPVPAVAAAVVEDFTPQQVVPLAELGARQCRFPIGDPQKPGFGYCGSRATMRSYCAAHHKLMYRPGSAKK